MKILVDMNLSPRWADFLRGHGLPADHWSALGDPRAPDAEIMTYAVTRGHVVLTHDLDFSAILAATRSKSPSVVQIRAGDLDPSVIGSKVAAALKQMEQELEAGALLTIDPARTRLRVLPLRE